ncbi:1-acyl-sn-glycerol-3-phosphate acyltransferase [Parapedobacter tibetensis]|uniref:1-acyl-sn-glycerol-3-phosphate acyltransferase n=1 Tax=Parapedobacter tibetensis TaxID=2972951 RepID=UPI00214DA439|nr:1-acyl-sn-glycerol-3-phosphate acyltransferase [Parapedobacter tibetensis]
MYTKRLALAALFYSIYRYLKKHRKAFFLSIPLVFILLGYLGSRIRFEEDIAKLIPMGEGSERINEVFQSVKFADKIIVNVSTPHENGIASLQEYADAFAETIERDAGPYIQRLQVRMEDDQLTELMDIVADNLPLFLDDGDYRQIDSLLQPQAVAEKVQESYRAITTPQGLITAPFVRQDPLGMIVMGLRKFQRLQSGDHFTLEDGYLVAHGRKNLLLFITPVAGASETAQNTQFIHLLDNTIKELNSKYNGQATAEYFGTTAVAVSNARQIKADIQITLSIALIILLSFFIYFYRRIYTPLIILLPSAFGCLLGITVLYLLKGTISAISIGIGSVLLGITLDYSLHILSHYRSTGHVKKLFESITKPLLMCAVFTAASFLCLLLLRSDVLKDLGIFATVSVFGAVVFALLFIPQVYVPHRHTSLRKQTFVDALARYPFSKNRWILGAGIILAVISLFTFQNVRFDNDLAALNYQPQYLKQAEANLHELTNHGAKSIYVVAYGDTYDEALEKNTQLYRQLEKQEHEGTILSFNSVGGIASSSMHQHHKIKQWNDFWSNGKKEHVAQTLIDEGRKVGFKENTFHPFFELMDTEFTLLDSTSYMQLDSWFLDEFISTGKGLVTVTSIIKTELENSTKLIETLSTDGEGILVIDRKQLQEKLLGNLKADFNKLFVIASVAVFVVIFFFFGSLELTLITNIPIFLGWFITLGLMGAFGIQFNAFNIIITTLIFGLGVDYAIFVTKGLLEQYTYGTKDMAAYKSGIIMSALSTIGCFGILVFAKHPAIRSISIIPLIGLLAVVLMSFSIQPWLFRTFISRPQEQGNTPWRILNLGLTGFTFGYFFLGGLTLSLVSQVLIPLVPMSKKKKFAYFHRAVRLFFHNLMYRTPFVKMEVIGQQTANYDRPVVVIANHTSILDTPTMGMLHPKQIFMVNDRVLRSKFFGKAIQMAGFYPSSENHTDGLDALANKIKQGYSIIIFPEGTRSNAAKINRFHKGAFYLSEQLQLDILPVLIHGNADALPKNDNMLKTGNITMKFLPKINYDDMEFGTTYVERTKKIAAYYREAFREFRRERESPDYFKNKLYFNYLYKPKHIQREVKSVFTANKTAYHQLVRQLPLKTTILHLGCGYGVLDFLLVYDSAERHVTAWDGNPEKISAARNTYSVNRYPLHFMHHIRTKIQGYRVLIVSEAVTFDWTPYLETLEWIVFDQAESDNFTILDGLEFQLVFHEKDIRIYRKNAGIV